ncbi:MAG: HAMP domain-containing histidine kinase [Chloroflexi bacterium]|nr:HAMP domain-containing histidine kinase [Chloroflexota bacterium]
MSEPKTSDGQAQADAKQSHNADPATNSATGSTDTGKRLHVVQPNTGGLSTHPLFKDSVGAGEQAPPWLRPFFSLRAQLLLSFCVLLTLVVVSVCILVYQQSSSSYIILVACVMIVVGAILAFSFTSLLLRPLWRVTDAAQAIAIGDLEQREKLPIRLPPQDEIDRLAGSISEMVTRLERAEETQRASEQRFKRFFSDASHQLRTPLTSIRGFTEILMRGAIEDPETTKHVLTRMKSESERMTTLINDLLTLSRLDSGHPLKLQYLDLVELAHEGVDQARVRSSDGRKISLVVDTWERLGVQADKERLKQLLFILLDNALKYGRPAPDGKIVVELGKQDGQVVMRVIDNGEGLAKEDLEHIFDAFYRARYRSSSSSSAVPTSGAGLGLAIAVTIVRAHHGTISASSELGKGTEFTVNLPCVG